MTWRLWRLIRGRYNPPAPPGDIAEARRKRLEAEFELKHARGRSGAVDTTVAAFKDAANVDEFTELIETAFARKGRR